LAARILHNSSLALSRKNGDKLEYIQGYIKGYDIWKNISFWEQYFLEVVSKQYRIHVKEDEKDDQFNRNILPLLISSFVYDMIITWMLPFDKVNTFVQFVLTANGKELSSVDQRGIKTDVDLFVSALKNKEKLKEAEIRLQRIHKDLDKKIKGGSRIINSIYNNDRSSTGGQLQSLHDRPSSTAFERASSGGESRTVGPHTHKFETKSFTELTKCAVCNKILFGTHKQGCACAICHITVHKKCASKAKDIQV